MHHIPLAWLNPTVPKSFYERWINWFIWEQCRRGLVALYYCLIVKRVNVYSFNWKIEMLWNAWVIQIKCTIYWQSFQTNNKIRVWKSLSVIFVATFQTRHKDNKHLLNHHFQLRKTLIDWEEQVSASGWILNAQINILQNIRYTCFVANLRVSLTRGIRN